MKLTKLAAAAAVATIAAGAASATDLRIQTHYGPETVSGKLVAEFENDVETMSNGSINIEMFYSSSVDRNSNAALASALSGSASRTAFTSSFASTFLPSWNTINASCRRSF